MTYYPWQFLVSLPTPPSQSATRTHQADSKFDQPEHRDSGRLGGQYIHNSLNASRQIKLKTFTDSPPGNFWRKEACRSEPSWPIFSLITSNALKTAPRPFSWSPKVCFTATIPYMAENSTMEMIYTPAYMIICIIIMHSKAKEYWYARCIFLQVSI